MGWDGLAGTGGTGGTGWDEASLWRFRETAAARDWDAGPVRHKRLIAKRQTTLAPSSTGSPEKALSTTVLLHSFAENLRLSRAVLRLSRSCLAVVRRAVSRL